MVARKLCPCGEKSLPGFISSVALCQKHYNQLMFGNEQEHKEGQTMLRMSQQNAAATVRQIA